MRLILILSFLFELIMIFNSEVKTKISLLDEVRGWRSEVVREKSARAFGLPLPLFKVDRQFILNKVVT